MEIKRIRQYTVEIPEDGMRLDEFLSYKIARFSRTRAAACIRGGGVSLDPFRPPKPALRIHVGDTVTLSQTMSGDAPQYEDVRMIDETQDFWVFDKPAGMAVHPTANIYHNTLTRYIETQIDQKPYVVHRLDRETSGVMIVAKNPEASRELDALFLSRHVHKQYDAIIYNSGNRYFPGKQENIDLPLGFAGRVLPRITMGLGDLEAHTAITCTEIHNDFAWCQAAIHSGRQHQIRVHLALTGTPILGDKIYLFGEAFYKSWIDGEDVPPFSPSRQMLHASRLAFEYHGKSFTYDVPAPDIFHQLFRSQQTESMFPTDYARLYKSMT